MIVSSMGNLLTCAGLVDHVFPSDDRWPGENRFLSSIRQYAISLIDPAQKYPTNAHLFQRKPQRPPVGICLICIGLIEVSTNIVL